jgi:hypothetical protein
MSGAQRGAHRWQRCCMQGAGAATHGGQPVPEDWPSLPQLCVRSGPPCSPRRLGLSAGLALRPALALAPEVCGMSVRALTGGHTVLGQHASHAKA